MKKSRQRTNINKEREDMAAKKASQAQAKMNAAKRGSKTAKAYTVMTISDTHASFEQVETKVYSELVEATLDSADAPLKISLQLDVPDPLKTGEDGFDNFVWKFKKDNVYDLGSGRGSQLISDNFGPLNSQMNTFLKMGTGVKSKLAASEQELLKSPWYWSCSPKMRCTGPEYGFLASLKVNTVGSRRCRIVNYKDCHEFMLSQRLAGATVSMAEVNEFLSYEFVSYF